MTNYYFTGEFDKNQFDYTNQISDINQYDSKFF